MLSLGLEAMLSTFSSWLKLWTTEFGRTTCWQKLKLSTAQPMLILLIAWEYVNLVWNSSTCSQIINHTYGYLWCAPLWISSCSCLPCPISFMPLSFLRLPCAMPWPNEFLHHRWPAGSYPHPPEELRRIQNPSQRRRVDQGKPSTRRSPPVRSRKRLENKAAQLATTPAYK